MRAAENLGRFTVRVSDHSFVADPAGGIAIPYGVYDLAADTGWVSVGLDHDTSVFAVAAIRRWWQVIGAAEYPRVPERGSSYLRWGLGV